MFSITSYHLGTYGEKVAKIFLTLKGYKILEMRFKTKVGEIDILAARGGTLVAVEVKYRKNQDTLPFSVTPFSRRRIRRSLEWAQKKYPHYANLRCDTLLISSRQWPVHMKNAF
jgi:putative endonuclease